MSIHKISSWILYLLMAASIVSAIVFYGVGFDEKNPANADQLLGVAYAFVILGLGVSLVLSLISFVKSLMHEPKKAVKNLVGPVVIIAIIAISYAMADGTPLNILGYNGPDNVPSMLKFADMALYSMYTLSIVAILMVIASSVIKLFK
jgi:hypothetical protein